MAKSKEKLMIIDGNALVHRSFHALPATMRTKSGEVTNAVYGFASFLMKAVREIRPEYVVLTMDKAGPTFRHKQYKEYKATRIKAPDELYGQIPRVKELAAAFDIPLFEKSGFEADDLIGTIANSVNGDVEKIILTGDQDTLQLVNDHVKVYSMSRGVTDSVIYDAAAVEARYGITPEQMVDYKALRGDPSDNIPGVRGIGEKTASELLQEFDSLDNIYKNVDANSKKIQEKVKPRIVELLKKHKKDAYLSQDLATIKCDVPIKFNLEKTRFRSYDRERAAKFLSELEFNSLLPRLAAMNNSDVASTKEERAGRTADKFERNRQEFKYILVDDEKKFKSFLAKLKKQKSFTFDTETSSFDPITANLLGISFSWNAGEAWFLKLRMTNDELRMKEKNLFNYQKNSTFDIRHSTLAPHGWLEELKPIFENKDVKKHGHNIKFDIRVMKNNGIVVEGADFDTMIASYLLNPGTRQHNLDAVTFTELNFEKISKDDLLGKGRERVGFSEVEDEKLMLYSAEDADFTERLTRHLAPKLKARKLRELFDTIEMPLVPVLAALEDTGVELDISFLKTMSGKLKKKTKEIEAKIYKQAGEKFNISSTQQLREILFENLEIPTDRVARTKTGLSTAASELDKLKDLHPIIKLIQEYRELAKLASTYVDALPELINPKTGRLHTSFNQTVAATGRLSSTEPNLQNIPIRTDLGREIRKAFTAAPGYRLLSLDYSQIELRLAAHFSGDPKMIKAFKHGADIHTATAAEINQVNPKVVDPEMRREAKAINFGILYGQGPRGLSQTADIPYERAREFIEQYFLVYGNIRKFIDTTLKQARHDGYVSTLFGRIRPLPEINSTVTMIRKQAERMAINTPLQGTAADMIKKAMVEIQAETIKRYAPRRRDSGYLDWPVRMILTVHDELVFEVKDGLVEEVSSEYKAIMEKAMKLKVPIVVDAKAGKNWGEMKGISI